MGIFIDKYQQKAENNTDKNVFLHFLDITLITMENCAPQFLQLFVSLLA